MPTVHQDADCAKLVVRQWGMTMWGVGAPPGEYEINVDISIIRPDDKFLGRYRFEPHEWVCEHGIHYWILPSDAQLETWRTYRPV